MHQQILVQDVEGWMAMKTVLSNSLSVVMVEENTSVDATVTLIASKSSSSKSLKFSFWPRAPLLPQDHLSQTLAKKTSVSQSLVEPRISKNWIIQIDSFDLLSIPTCFQFTPTKL